jgi:polysaccharide export outer membrane protein
MIHLRPTRRQRQGALLLSIFCSFLLIYSCASAPPPKRESPVSLEAQTREIESSAHVRAMNESLLMRSLSSRKDAYRDYRIGPEDLIEVTVFEDEKLNRAVRVSSQGNISLPLIGVIRVKGLTSTELEREIRDLLSEKYIQNPNVNVFIKEYRSQRISVIGAVEKPGTFDISGQKTLLDLLAMAGGLKEEAGPQLFLIRPSVAEDGTSKTKESDSEGPKTFIIELEELLLKGDLTLNLTLTHGDILNIPVSGKVFVSGEVKRPGGFPLKGKRVTLSQAVAMAEGLKQEANGTEVKVFRFPKKGAERTTLTVDLHAIQKGQAEDILLQENDIVVVPKSGVKAFLIEFRDTLKGLIGFGFSLGGL